MLEIGTIIAISSFVIVQAVAAFAWGSKLMSRITAIEVRLSDTDKSKVIEDHQTRITRLETKSESNDVVLMEIKASLIRIEERLNHIKGE